MDQKPAFESASSTRASLEVLNEYEFREICAFVQNEMFRVSKRIDGLYAEF